MTRIETSNAVLRLMQPDTSIERRKGGWYVCWTRYCKTPQSRRWVTRGNDFYPLWHHKWGRGGTVTTALSQLVRWCGEKPVLPLPTWRYWMSPTVRLGDDSGDEIVRILTDGGYPEATPCVLCGLPITGRLDWWSLDGISGPSCRWTEGCRQWKDGDYHRLGQRMLAGEGI